MSQPTPVPGDTPLLSICKQCGADISRSCLVGMIKLPTVVSGLPTIHRGELVPGPLRPVEATILLLLRPQRCPECNAPVLFQEQVRQQASSTTPQ